MHIERLFGANGACGGCWCMYWRTTGLGAYWASHKGDPNKQAFRKLIEDWSAKGCLAFDGDDPIGWCSYGRREDFPYLSRSRSIPDPHLADVWCITCFYVLPGYRNKGTSGKLIACALKAAKSEGAAYLEGYPTVPKSTKAIPPVFVHTGLPGAFRRNGFREVANAGAKCVMRISIRDDP